MPVHTVNKQFMRTFLSILSALLLATPIFCQKKAPANEALPLKLEWQLITNNYQKKSELLSSFTLTNTGKKPFANTGWAVYFNYNREIDSKRITGNVEIAHLNGDLYRMRPAANFPAMKAGETAKITYISDGELRNYASAPNGFYLVWDNAPEKGLPISDLRIAPIVDTTIAWVTPENVFERNRSISDFKVANAPKIFPTPASFMLNYGEFKVTSGVTIFATPIFENEGHFLADALEPLIGKKLTVNSSDVPSNKIFLKKGDMPREAYTLTVRQDSISIVAGSQAGAFYAVQSLLSLVPPEAWGQTQPSVDIWAVEVHDAPRFGYRSLSFDVARNFRTKKEVFRILDVMAMCKMNVLHFHLTEDEGWRIEIPGLPELTEIGAKRGHSTANNMLQPAYGSGPVADANCGSGFYTRADYIDILKYATARHIEIIPEIESPGHSRAAIKAMQARYDKLMAAGKKTEAEQYRLNDPADASVYSSAQLWTDNVMCVAMPSVYTFMEKVVDEIIAMHAEAQAPLHSINMGGDEVPAGAWEKSPICQQLIATDPSLENTNDLWYYYYGKLNDMLQHKNLYMSGWEEMAMRKTKLDGQNAMIPNPGFAGKNIQVHVWNNVVGWGAEDLPYRLANAGFKVVLSPVSNNYLDMAYYKNPDEPGYYWGGYQDIDKPFYFVPFDYYKTTKEGPDGSPVDQKIFVGKDRLTDFGKSNIVGIEGLIWSETIHDDAALEYMVLPKIFGIAERAWAPDPAWATEKDPSISQKQYDKAWAEFVNTIGKRVLPRLDNTNGGYNYRIPTPGIKTENGQTLLNIQFPGLTIRYTTDGTEPTATSKIYTGPITEKGQVRARAFNSKGRGSRVVMGK